MAERTIIWTDIATKQSADVFAYWIARNGSTLYAEKLLHLIEEKIKLIIRHPEAFKSNIYPDTREAFLEQHYSIFYKFNEDQIQITAFWDNRQDPKKLIKILKASK